MKKQIDFTEMAEDILEDFASSYSQVDEKTLANYLKYHFDRKASDVARDVIDNILSKIRTMIREIEKVEGNGNSYFSEFNGGSKTALEIVSKDIAELKNKYESEGEK